MNPIDVLEQELVMAAASRQRQWRPTRRTLLLAAALVVLVAVPAWATGLLRDVFPQSAPPNFGPGVPVGIGQRDFLVAGGTTARGDRWRLTIQRNPALQSPGRRTSPGPAPPDRRWDCYALAIGPAPQGGGGACGFPGMTSHPVVALDGVTTGPVTRRDRRTLVLFITAPQNDRLLVRLRSGRAFFVRPLRIDQAKLRRTGLRFPFGVVAFTIPHRDPLRGLATIDARGRVTASEMRPGRVPQGARTIRSPAL